MGGGIGTDIDTAARIDSIASLPSQRFRVIAVNLESVKGVQDADLKQLESLSSLENLSLHNTTISDEGFRHLAGLKNLRSLYVWSPNFNGAGLQHLKAADHLARVYLKPSPIVDDSVRYLLQNPNLTTVLSVTTFWSFQREFSRECVNRSPERTSRLNARSGYGVFAGRIGGLATVRAAVNTTW